MQDYEQNYDFGVKGSYVNTVIEVPKNSILKIEFNREKKTFVLDRVEPSIFAKPASYGFIPKTTDEDNDPLDTLLITAEPVPTGVVVKARVIAVMNFVDGGEQDHKIVCVPEDDRNSGANIKSLADLDPQWVAQVEFHFNHYKDLKRPGTVEVTGWGDTEAAWQIIDECSERFKGETE